MSKAEELSEKLGREWRDDALNYDTALDASIELRRLSAINAELLEALKTYQRAGIGNSTDFLVQNLAYERGLAAIAKAQGEQL
jgi:hypothetical protein